MILSRYSIRAIIPLVAITYVLLAASALFAQGSKRFDYFMENWTKAEKAREAGDFAAAAEDYQRVFEYARFEPSSRFLLARCLARLGQKDLAIAELTRAVDYGWNDAEAISTGEFDLESLRGDPRMATVVSAAKDCAREDVIWYRGTGATSGERVPLLVILHGLGDAPRGNFAYWKDVADKLGLVIVAPYGVTRLGAGMSYAWHREDGKGLDLNVPASRSAIERAIKTATESSAVDDQRIILAGFSQGGALALCMLVETPERFLGAIAMCTTYKPLGEEVWRRTASRGRLSVHLTVGKFDRWFEAGTEAYEEMRAGGVNVALQVNEEMGHEMPVDYVGQQVKALEFILRVD